MVTLSYIYGNKLLQFGQRISQDNRGLFIFLEYNNEIDWPKLELLLKSKVNRRVFIFVEENLEIGTAVPNFAFIEDVIVVKNLLGKVLFTAEESNTN